MATGIEMMVSALLKAVGFSREQFDGTLQSVKTEFDAMKARAINAENALNVIRRSQSAIIKHLGIVEPDAPETADTRQGVLSFVHSDASSNHNLNQPAPGEKEAS